MYFISFLLSTSALLFSGSSRLLGLVVIGVIVAAVFFGARKIGILNDI
jgi:hypothetical protein